jgi:hypothetical protein
MNPLRKPTAVLMMLAGWAVLNAVHAGEIHLTAMPDGDQEVPPVVTEASGEMALVLNEERTELAFELNVMNLDPVEIAAAHLHLGAAGVNGPVIFVLSDVSFESPLSGVLTEVDLAAQPSLGVETFDDAVEMMLQGMVYVNVHSTAFPDGEIRGQVGRLVDIEVRRAINPRSKGVVKVCIPSTEDFDVSALRSRRRGGEARQGAREGSERRRAL